MDYSQFITLSNHTNILSENNSNNSSNFDRKIPKLDLEFGWKCGLHEISISKTWNTIPFDEDIEILLYDKESLYNVIGVVTIPSGDYNNESLVETINSRILADISYVVKTGNDYTTFLKGTNIVYQELPHFYFNESNLLVFKPGNEEVTLNKIHIKMSEDLSRILGFKYNKILAEAVKTYGDYFNELPRRKEDKIVVADKFMNLNNYFRHLFLHSDNLCKEYYINEKDINDETLLHIISIPHDAEFDDQINLIFNSPA